MSKFKTILNHARPVSPHGGVSMTQQQYKKECDINSILKRYQITGELPVSKSGVFGDFSDFGDFQICMDKINRATSEFTALPSDLRARFGNDPSAFVRFALDPANAEECVRLGIRERRVVEDKPVDVLKRIEKVVTPPVNNVTSTEGKPSSAV